MPDKKISIRDIAEKSGVSVATVSRVINQNGRYSAETEARVRQIMEEYNYVPNLLARGLRQQQVPEIGIIVPDITNEFFGRLVVQIESELFEHGYTLTICNTNEDRMIERRYLEMIRAKQMCGLIRISHEHLREEELIDIPTVYLDRIPENIKYTGQCISVESDHEQGGYIATKELIKQGCRNVGIVLHDAEISTKAHEMRYIGYKRALEEANIEFDVKKVIRVKRADCQNGGRAALEFIERRGLPDGLFCTSDLLAVGALDEFLKHGVNVPEQVRIVGYDNISLAKMMMIPITTISHPEHTMVDITCRYFLSAFAKEESELQKKKRIVLPVELIKRETA